MIRDEGQHHACAFVDQDHAWVVGLASEAPDRHMVVYRTTDGGVTWSASGLGDDHYTDWPVAPGAELPFDDSLFGRLLTVDPPGHHTAMFEHRSLTRPRTADVHGGR